jgi:hypothetical protein
VNVTQGGQAVVRATRLMSRTRGRLAVLDPTGKKDIATSPDTVPALARPQFHCRITDLLLPSVGTLKEGEKGRRVRPFCLVGTECRCAYNRKRRSPTSPRNPLGER